MSKSNYERWQNDWEQISSIWNNLSEETQELLSTVIQEDYTKILKKNMLEIVPDGDYVTFVNNSMDVLSDKHKEFFTTLEPMFVSDELRKTINEIKGIDNSLTNLNQNE